MIPIKSTLSQAWELFKKHWKFLLLVTVISWIFQGLPRSFEKHDLYSQSWLILAVLSLALSALNLVIDIGLTKVYLKIVDRESAKLEDLFVHYKLFWKFLAGSILYGLIVVSGLFLLIVPGIIWAIKFQFYSYLIVDKNLGPIEALRQSSNMTQGKKWQILKFDLVIGLLNILGILALIVGLLITIPVTTLGFTLLYRKLSPKS